jgi:hypothetical protein
LVTFPGASLRREVITCVARSPVRSTGGDAGVVDGVERFVPVLDRLRDKLYDDLERAGGQDGRPRSPKTVANLHNRLHKAFADAVKRGRLHRSPADAVPAPTATKVRSRWWTVDELRAFLLHVEDDDLYPAFLPGTRPGEGDPRPHLTGVLPILSPRNPADLQLRRSDGVPSGWAREVSNL